MIKAITSLNELQNIILENKLPLENITSLETKKLKVTETVLDNLNGVFIVYRDREVYCLEISKNSLKETLLEIVKIYTYSIKEFSIRYCYIKNEYKLEKIRNFLKEQNSSGKRVTETELITFIKLLKMKEI